MNSVVKRQRIAITFDVDMMDYAGLGKALDEMDNCFSIIKVALKKFPEVKTTWFLRIDAQMREVFGNSDYLFIKHGEKIEWLLSNGHQIGWHHHAYKRLADSWIQEVDSEIVCADIQRFGERARKLDISAARMGWGWQNNESIGILDKLGFLVDSSCIPRPSYPWENSVKDWSLSPNSPYRPSRANYQMPAAPCLGLLEIPITTAFIPTPSDTLRMLRYVNLAYKHDVFRSAVMRLSHKDLIVTITHPYEVLAVREARHPLLSFCAEQLEKNLKFLADNKAEFVTLGDVEHSFSGR